MSTLAKRFEFVRFVFGNIPSSFLFVSVSVVCIRYYDMWYIYGFAIAQVVSSTPAYFIQRKWVFKDGSRYTIRQHTLYFLVSSLYQASVLGIEYALGTGLDLHTALVVIITAVPKTLIGYKIFKPMFKSIEKAKATF